MPEQLPLYQQRPPWLQHMIRDRFAAIINSKGRPYGYNGDVPNYSFGLGLPTAIGIRDELASTGRRLRVLDIGAGAGGFVVDCLQAGHDSQGISAHDYPKLGNYKKVTALLPEASYIVADAHTLTALPGLWPEYDLIVSHSTLMHFADPIGTLEQAANRVAANGILLATEIPMEVAEVYASRNNSSTVIHGLEAAGFDTTGSRLQPSDGSIDILVARRGSVVSPVYFPVTYSN